jgi:DNA-binding response OmpR family regulator
MRVLVIEDEVRLAQNIASALRESSGLAVDLADNGDDGLLLAEHNLYDLIILDLMLPGTDGQKVVRRLRKAGDETAILILSARSERPVIVELLNLGADDYLTKPFDLGELLARVKALIRRGKGVRNTTLNIGRLSVNSVEQTVRCGDQLVDLSPTEYKILEYLGFRPRMIVSKRELLEHMYDYTWEHHSNVIEVHVSNLRRKLRAIGEATTVLTVRGRGYRLDLTREPL